MCELCESLNLPESKPRFCAAVAESKLSELRQKKEDIEACWQPIYCTMVTTLLKEYSDKGWGQVDEKAMEGIISKAKAIADLHQKVASATV